MSFFLLAKKTVFNKGDNADNSVVQINLSDKIVFTENTFCEFKGDNAVLTYNCKSPKQH